MIPTVNNGNKFFDQLPDDARFSIFEFWKGAKGSLSQSIDDRAVIATAAVCKSWRDNVSLAQERIEASARLRLRHVHNEMTERGYPLETRQIFRSSNMPIARLPILGLHRDGDYIDWLHPEDLSDPVMRFKDLRGRPGIALCLQHRTHQPMTRQAQVLLAELPVQEQIDLMEERLQEPLPTEVLTIFKRDATPDSHWTFGNDSAIELRAPNAFPHGYLVSPIFLQELLTDQHSLYRIRPTI